LVNFIGLHPNLAIAAAFIVSAGEALPIVGLFSPSTVVLVAIGGLVGLGKVSFWPAFIATILGAALGDAISYWTGRIYKERLVEIWPFSRYHGLLTAGQHHFSDGGAVSIVIGRFIPGIKPVVAGMMGMGAFRFTLINVFAATAWAAVHILPGLSAGLALTGPNLISDGLAAGIGVLAIGLLLAMWFAKGKIGLVAPDARPRATALNVAVVPRGDSCTAAKTSYAFTSPTAAECGNGTVRPSAIAVLRLIIMDLCGLLDWQIGRLLALRIRPVSMPTINANLPLHARKVPSSPGLQ
jgi:membrane protein DedA with SNARE-associated domain